MRLVLLTILAVLCGLAAGPGALAHEVRPALVDISEQAPGRWQVTWKQPVMGEQALRLRPELSNGWLKRTPSGETVASDHYMKRWNIRAPASQLDGATLRVDGLDRTITDVLVRIRRADGSGSDTILRGNNPAMIIGFKSKQGFALPAYLGLGVHHILTGVDHLLFVLGLLLLIGLSWRLVSAITAFTLAHSLTLAASTLGFVEAPVAVIEALIAWSIVFVAFELTRGDGRGDGVTRRWPWLVAFVFGLLHGFGFAGALSETGLPHDDVPLALLLFNLGVEAGQLLFIVAALILALAWRSLADRHAWQPRAIALRRLVPYAMGCYASFLFFERTASAFA